jgi:hypothetical protein
MTNKKTSRGDPQRQCSGNGCGKRNATAGKSGKVDLFLGVFCFVEDHGVEAVADEEA